MVSDAREEFAAELAQYAHLTEWVQKVIHPQAEVVCVDLSYVEHEDYGELGRTVWADLELDVHYLRDGKLDLVGFSGIRFLRTFINEDAIKVANFLFTAGLQGAAK